MTILLTGFTPFGDLATNPTQAIVTALAAHPALPAAMKLVTEVLPTEYCRGGQRLQTLLDTHQPDIYIGLGVAQQRRTINLERVALNLNDAHLADNAGETRQGQRIIESAPLAYFSNVALEDLRSQLSRLGHTVTLSNHAGTYVCNHVYFLALHHAHLAQTPTQCLFIHVPFVPPQETAKDGLLTPYIQCITACLQALSQTGSS